jgi:hypothetical protein
MTPEQAASLRRSVRQLVRAEIAYSWKENLTDRDDIAIVEEELKSAKSRFGLLLRNYTTELPAGRPESNPEQAPATQPTVTKD